MSRSPLDRSTPDYTQKIRYFCPDDDPTLAVTSVVVNGDRDSTGQYRDTLCDALQRTAYIALDRVYVVFPEEGADPKRTPDEGKSYICADPADPSHGKTVANNSPGPAYAVTEFVCWTSERVCANEQTPTEVTLHEVLHMLGSVHPQSPGGDNRKHEDDPDPRKDRCRCHSIDYQDVMTNRHRHDDSFGNPPSNCLEKEPWWVDCKKNTYYDPQPSSSEWLFTTGWNIARSVYLTNSAGVPVPGHLVSLLQ